MTKLIDADALLEAIHKIYGTNNAPQGIINLITNAPTVQNEGWVSVEDRLPDDSKCVLAIVIDKNNLKGWHWEIVNYGSFSFYDANGNSPDADEDGEVRRFGWHYGRESEGEYDYLIFDLKDKVTHWQPLTRPAATTDTE